ncbi:single-stranded-DNA-specific exonuclease RecJ [Spirulina major CS-329]|uniref:single-stranded-DNA-specific exonuclease RecJ n=1 Tax=Spirulina TaxID=1154 RepID=UPI00233060E6|nr:MULTISPECIES: single-stranded-DNA-specific exonuclease RecJ [Spirulina]MDB9494760.1 single-stranded-DNA-specific exonuclease RecJ [Spirulina subsalsa CS-330]MDB9503149.1 single-stranded-DNA-specific exonuclease RecJ [Spirulina major CS-329]
MALQARWQQVALVDLPADFLAAVGRYCGQSAGEKVAQLLWRRGICDRASLDRFIDPRTYQPCDPFAFGVEMERAVDRLDRARQEGERVTIWGDFDADGITSTSVLWDGLGQFFPPEQLDYYIPNRDRESHGLNIANLDRLATEGTTLIVTCDTGSTNLTEIAHAHRLGIEIIVTDHHTLPPERPDVVAIVNPRYFDPAHPLYHLSGVAVAYKLVEALYQRFPDLPQTPLTDLLDLVAIGLIADLVALQGDCRYLAQVGIEQLRKQDNPQTATRPGVAELLKLCKRSGDRPTDISFGIGPRINAVSRIQGDARFCVELLTSRDRQRCQALAEQTELANSRRKELQKTMVAAVEKRLEQVDLSTTHVIVLDDPQWSAGVLGLVAGQVAQDYGRPTILLTLGDDGMARGSARSTHGIDLYQLVYSQRELLHRFGGHPFAAGLSLAANNLPLFREGINQTLRRQLPDPTQLRPTIAVDLTVTVAELGETLFKELKLLEPCGMGNPAPLLLIEDCWFPTVRNANIKDRSGKQVKYIKTQFIICDRTSSQGFPGMWWGHYSEELTPDTRFDAIAELDYNTYQNRYEIRLIDLRPSQAHSPNTEQIPAILDWRTDPDPNADRIDCVRVDQCPLVWDDIQQRFHRAIHQAQPLALAYHAPSAPAPEDHLKRLIAMAQHLHTTGHTVTLADFQAALQVSDRQLTLSLAALTAMGFSQEHTPQGIRITAYQSPSNPAAADVVVTQLCDAIAETHFRHTYFERVPLATVQQKLAESEV